MLKEILEEVKKKKITKTTIKKMFNDILKDYKEFEFVKIGSYPGIAMKKEFIKGLTKEVVLSVSFFSSGKSMRMDYDFSKTEKQVEYDISDPNILDKIINDIKNYLDEVKELNEKDLTFKLKDFKDGKDIGEFVMKQFDKSFEYEHTPWDIFMDKDSLRAKISYDIPTSSGAKDFVLFQIEQDNIQSKPYLYSYVIIRGSTKKYEDGMYYLCNGEFTNKSGSEKNKKCHYDVDKKSIEEVVDLVSSFLSDIAKERGYQG